jgi:hypothetical protein
MHKYYFSYYWHLNLTLYNFIATHTQAQDDAQAIAIRRQEFDLIGKLIVNSHQLNIPRNDQRQPVIGDPDNLKSVAW